LGFLRLIAVGSQFRICYGILLKQIARFKVIKTNPVALKPTKSYDPINKNSVACVSSHYTSFSRFHFTLQFGRTRNENSMRLALVR
jgi:hypothetical protein